MKRWRRAFVIVSMILLSCWFAAEYSGECMASSVSDYQYGSKASRSYFVDGVMPTFQRTAPIAEDDPGREKYADAEILSYEYGYVFHDVNDYYYHNPVADKWEGRAPEMDTGVLVGGNAYSKHDAKELDSDSDNYNSILPYAGIFIKPEALSSKTGEIEYEFFTNTFNYNDSDDSVPENITILGNDRRITNYQVKFPDLSYPQKHDSQRPADWSGIIYTGGISKTVKKNKNTFTETVVHNDQGNGERLFTVRYKNAAMDSKGKSYDLVLSFTQITFVAEAGVAGPIAIFEESSLYLAPILYKDGKYAVSINDTTNKVDVHDQDGVRIGARFEFDYRIEDKDGNMPKGLLMFSMNDLDNASMATMLQTDADWGTNRLGNDFKWAEGFGVKKGAASPVVMPYFNHEVNDVNGNKINSPNGDEGLIRTSRMKGTKPDGTANGLYFTTSITSVSGSGARNDADTPDTGVSMLLYPSGSFVSAISAGRRGNVNIRLFDSRATNEIEQSSSKGGKIYTVDYDYANREEKAENTEHMKVVGGGSNVTCYMEPDDKFDLYVISIDDVDIYYRSLKWEEQSDGSFMAKYKVHDEYGKLTTTTTYKIYRNNSGKVWIPFKNIQDNHKIYAEYVQYGLFTILKSVSIRVLVAILLVAGFAILLIASTVFWLVRGRKESDSFQPTK